MKDAVVDVDAESFERDDDDDDDVDDADAIRTMARPFVILLWLFYMGSNWISYRLLLLLLDFGGFHKNT